MGKLIKRSLPQQIAEAIEEKIKNGDYQVGDKLPTEPNLVEMFGVSRNTVREAIQSLTHSGILEARQGDGTYVVAKEKLQVEIFHMMSASTYQNISEVRELLEKHIVVSAVSNRTEQDLAEIEHFLQLRKQEIHSARETTQADLDFHIAIAKATHNDIILSVYQYVSEYIQGFIYHKIHEQPADQSAVDDMHETLFEAIRHKNAALALDCIERIIES